MKHLMVACIVLASACGGTLGHWRGKALQAARFDTGCQAMKVVAEQPDATTVRYRVAGCGKTVVYICSNVGGAERDALDIMVMGSHTIDTNCKPLR